LTQGYHDLRISVDKRFKISKGVKVNCLWNPNFGSSEEIFGGSKFSEVPIFTDLAFSLDRRAVKENLASLKEYSFT
jgi:hypothetical protein